MATKKVNDLLSVLIQHKFYIDSIDMTEITCVICKGILKNATQSTCGCNFCFECIKSYLGNSSKLCPSGRVCCSDEILSMEKDIQIDHRVNRNISLLKVKCPNEGCSFEDMLGSIGSHIRICEKTGIQCPYANIGCGERNITKDKLIDHLHANIYSHSTLVTESIENINNELSFIGCLKRDIEAIKTTEIALVQQVEEQKLEIETLKSNNRNLSQTVEDLMANGKKNDLYQNLISKINQLEKTVDKLSNVTKTDDFLWKIDDFSLKQKAILPIFRKELTSSAFYTHKGGYKLRLKVHPNGYGKGVNTHLFVCFCIMKGDFDDRLEWPFKHTVKLSLVDQTTGEDHKGYSFCYDKVSEEFADVFMKPKNQINKVLGEDEFITFEELFSNCDLLKKDTIVIRCSVNIC